MSQDNKIKYNLYKHKNNEWEQGKSVCVHLNSDGSDAINFSKYER